MIHTELITSIGNLVRLQAETRGDKVAWWDAASSVTWRQVAGQTANLAGHLQELGLAPGERVAIYLPNSVEWVVSCLAIARAGLVSVPISYDAAPAEVTYRLADAAVRAVITTDSQLERLDHARREAGVDVHVIVRGHSVAAPHHSLRAFADQAPATPPRDPGDLDVTAFIIYTSGTTGKAKGVRLTTRSMLWVVAACWVPITGLSERDTVLSSLPLFHSYALNLSVLAILATGASEYLMEKYSSHETLRLLQTKQFTVLPGVPTMFHYLLETAKSESSFALDGMRLCISAGAILPAQLNGAFEEQFRIRLLDGYGITETSTMVTMNWPTGTRILGSCGLPVPGLATRIVSPLTGGDVAPGDEGELIVRGPNLMQGYHNKPAETAAAVRDGWYHTGDLARSDASGYLTITGRLKELIIRGGQNIAPAEIEDAVNQHPSVLDCAAVGIAHEHLGEVPVVFVVIRPRHELEAAGLLAHCRNLLSSYKVPTTVHVVEAIPRTGSGKVMRFKLKELLG